MIENQIFKDKLNSINKIRYVNYGGCGIVTLSLLRWLDKNFSEEIQNFKLVLIYESYENNKRDIIKYKHTNKSIYLRKNKIGFGIVPYHIGLLYKDNYFIDAEGIFNLNEYLKKERIDKKNVQIFSSNSKFDEFLVYLINQEPADWNYIFNRKNGVRKLKSLLKINLSEIKIK
jgi:hypothetical protein